MISVIVPVHNASNTLRRCVNSILTQSYKNIELILINDASTDNTLQICQDCQNKDKRVKIVDNRENLGSEKSRLNGIKEAKGNWIMFIDADDRLAHHHVISNNLKLGEKYEVDMVQFGCRKVTKRGILKQKKLILPEGHYIQPEISSRFYTSFFGINNFPSNQWGKLYKSSIFQRVELNCFDVFMGDDQLFLMQIFPFLNSLYISNEVGYYYYIGGNSSNYPFLIDDALKLFNVKKREIEEQGLIHLKPYIHYELKNYFKSDLINKIKDRKEGKKELIQYINRIVNTHLSEVIDYYRKEVPVASQEPFVRAILNNDCEKVLEICCNILKKHRIQNYFRNIVTKYL